MRSDVPGKHTKQLKTCGVGTFGEEVGGYVDERLFKVVAGHDAEYALEQASMLLNCVYRITSQGGAEQDTTLVWAAHYLSGMAKALVEDVTHGMLTGPVR
ncbi:DUF3077 domain-containing protein [Pseudomonas capeferrum]|uniref:DUF3077 domain-containing protein n=1 Tax=Pseudomonas capeferrum TaxID=1495066 RepID=UPI0015E36D69|nr:DUF3077 domain-containing protein [Pseudomonas capeferrum]MBA1201422.1 DUF3077 domain-containing protein [Pseudomonas capeferrum]